jgi:hypothetical protein
VPFTIDVTDLAGNAGTQVTTTTDASSVLFDRTAPTVLSSVRKTPSTQLTNATTVTYTVTFSEAVTGVDVTDFTLSTTNTAAGTINSVSGSGTTYDVNVNSITGDGTMGLDVKSSGTGIKDGASNDLSGGYSAGQTYIFDHTLPTLTTVAISSNNATSTLAKVGDKITVSFTSSETLANFPVGTIAGHTAVVTNVSGNNWKAEYIMQSTDVDGPVTFSISFADLAGNNGTSVSTVTSGGGSVTFDKTAPTVVTFVKKTPNVSVTNASSVTYTVTFSEDVTGVDAADFAIAAAGVTTDASVAVTTVSAHEYDLQITSVNGNGTLGLNLKTTAAINDLAGNPIGTAGYTGSTYTIDQTAPYVVSSNRAASATNPTTSTSVVYRVTFSESVSNVDISDFGLTATGTVSGTIASVSGSGAIYDVTVNSISGYGTLRLNVNSSGTGIQDVATNALSGGFTSGQTYTFFRNTTLTITKPTPTVTSGQYSDVITLEASLVDDLGNAVVNEPIVFQVGSQTLNAVNTNSSGIATTTLKLNQDPNASTNDKVKASFAGDSPIYTSSSDEDNYDVVREDARITYTGAMFTSTSGTSSSAATVTLAATVQDITAVSGDLAYDAYDGDIRNARVTFKIYNATNALVATVGPLTPGLITLGDLKTGTVTSNWNVDIGNNNAAQYTVRMFVDNYYVGDNSAEPTVIDVAKPLNDFITGGGYQVLQNATGLINPQNGRKNNFGFDVKWNKSGTNLQGNINTIVKGSDGHVYQVKGNSMTSLSIQPATSTAPGTAIFNGKASIQDVTDPNNTVSVDGGATLQVTMTDFGDPSGNNPISYDKIAITVWNKNGGLWFSSNWNGVKTDEQQIAKGNLKVNSSNSNITGTLQTTMDLTSSLPVSSTVGQSVTFTAKVVGSSTSKPSGNVLFVDYSTNSTLGTAALNSSTGVATYTTATLSEGPHHIIAYYSGDSKYTSNSDDVTQTVISGAITSSKAQKEINQVPLTAPIEMSVSAYPNPAQSQFNIKLQSSNTVDPISIVVYGVNGNVVEHKQNLKAGQSLVIGGLYRPGVYVLEMIQGKEHKQLKLVKIPD